MSIEVIQGITKKPAVSGALVDCISSLPMHGLFFIGHPVIPTSEGPHTIDALLICKEKGIVVFDLIEESNEGDYSSRQDDSVNRLESLLKTHRDLMARRKLRIPIHAISFAPRLSERNSHENQDGYPIAFTQEALKQHLTAIEAWSGNVEHVYRKSLSVVQNVSSIRKNRNRGWINDPESKGGIMKRLEDSIATLDIQQNRAVIETVQGVQRIRGLAGSGKTVILALKAAYLHIQHPDWRIAITFRTRSLYQHFHHLITKFTLAQAHIEPDWSQLTILNAWGASDSSRNGIYRKFCQVHDLKYYDFNAAKRFGAGKEFSGACAQALSDCREFKSLYDVILIDEAQDLPPEFLRICYHLLDEKKMLIYAYDELQNLSHESLPSPEQIFGTDINGAPLVALDPSSNQDIVLKKCYRNSRPVISTAHSLGFGIYRKSTQKDRFQLVQMFEDPRFWKDIGYDIKGGSLLPGSSVILSRTEDSSPPFLEDHSHIEDLIQFMYFDDAEKQTQWLAKEIANNLENDELRYEDIIVINPDPLTTRKNVGHVRSYLLDLGINNHLAGITTSPDIFVQPPDSIVFTGVHRAKGNEASMVYIINAHECYSGPYVGLNLAKIRNQLFTAMTRSKAWVRVLGVGDGMKELKKEYDHLQSKNFQLEFDYPTKEEIKHLRVIHRDACSEDIERFASNGNYLTKLVEDLESGSIQREDLDKNLVTKLRSLLPE